MGGTCKLEAALDWFEQERLQHQSTQFDPIGIDIDYTESMRKHLDITMAQILILRDQLDEAIELLDSLFQEMEQQERIDFLIEIRTLQAIAHQARGDIKEALAVVENALVLAEPGGYVRTFLDKGEAMRILLQQAEREGIMGTYVRMLLGFFDDEMLDHQRMTEVQLSSSVFSRSSALVEPLSEREIQVLRLLQTNLSSPEIADELFIAVSTVRTHIKNIYSKLGVHNRTQAVIRARELELL